MDQIYANIDDITGSLQQKLIDGKQEAYHSKKLTQIMTVPGYDALDVEQWKCEPDFDHMKKILVDGFEFHSLEKVIDEVKKQWQGGEQLSLFG